MEYMNPVIYLIDWLKVLSYWNLNLTNNPNIHKLSYLKVLSYWNLNKGRFNEELEAKNLKYYHIGI